MISKKQRICLFGALLPMLCLSACAGGAAHTGSLVAEKPPEEPFRTALKQEPSHLNVTLEASDRELSDTLNRLTPHELYRGSTGTNGLTAVVLRNGPLQVVAADNFIHLTVPIALTLRYGIFEAPPLTAKLSFKITASVTPDWKVHALVYYTGLSDLLAEEVRIGPFSFRPRHIVDGITQPVQRVLADLIAWRLNERFPLRPEVLKIWNAAQRPILLDRQYRAWLTLTPHEALLYPLYAQHHLIRLGVGLTTFADLVVGPEPAAHPPVPLPNLLQERGGDRTFRVALQTDLYYKDLLAVAAPLLLNKEFSSDGRHVVLKRMELYGSGNHLVIRLETTGSLDGVLYLTCRPAFNPRTNIFSVEDLEFDLQTRSMLLKTADWFLHGAIRRAIQERLNLDLSQRLEQARAMANKALTRVSLGGNLFLNGTVTSISLHDVLVQRDKLSIQLYTEGTSGIVLH